MSKFKFNQFADPNQYLANAQPQNMAMDANLMLGQIPQYDPQGTLNNFRGNTNDIFAPKNPYMTPADKQMFGQYNQGSAVSTFQNYQKPPDNIFGVPQPQTGVQGVPPMLKPMEVPRSTNQPFMPMETTITPMEFNPAELDTTFAPQSPVQPQAVPSALPSATPSMDFGLSTITPIDTSWDANKTAYQGTPTDVTTEAGFFDNVSGKDWLNFGLQGVSTLAGMYGMKQNIKNARESLRLNRDMFESKQNDAQRQRDVSAQQYG